MLTTAADQLKLFPELLFKAIHTGQPVTAYKLWFLAKGFDQPGCGFIPAKAFRQYLHSLDIPRQTITRWLGQAETLGLITPLGKVYGLCSWQAGAMKAGCERLARPVNLPLSVFIAKGWLSHCWAGYLLRFKGLVSRQTLYKLSGVPPRTQQAYENQAQVINQFNYASYGSVQDNPELAIKLYDQDGHYTKQGQLRRQLPNNRIVSGISLANKGRLKQVNGALCVKEDSSPSFAHTQRRYSHTPQQTKRAIRRDRKKDIHPRERIAFIYEFTHQLHHHGIFMAIAL